MATTINANTSTGFIATSDTSGVLQLQTGGTAAVTVDASQNVGIGTASPASDARLTLASPTTESYVMFSRTNSGVFDAAVGNNAGSLVFKGGADSATVAGLTEFMRINSSGNVGIGTSSPVSKLDVQTGTGDDSANSTLTIRSSGNQRLDFYNNWSTATGVRARIESDADSISQLYGTLKFYTTQNSTVGVTERMRIDSSGNLLVGTTSANARLTVNGIDATSSNNSFIARNSSNTILIQARNDGFVFLPTTYNNTLGVSANLFVNTDGSLSRATSSAKYKREIVDARFGLNDALKLRPVNYKDKSTDSETLYGGLIAEEVHEAGLTEFVYYAEDGTPDALHYGNMVSLCIKAIQEQQAIIQTLTDRITALEGTTP